MISDFKAMTWQLRLGWTVQAPGASRETSVISHMDKSVVTQTRVGTTGGGGIRIYLKTRPT